MATYRVVWNEGDPVILVAPSFGAAEGRFITYIQESTAPDDERPTADDVTSWIECLEKLSDEDPIQ